MNEQTKKKMQESDFFLLIISSNEDLEESILLDQIQQAKIIKKPTIIIRHFEITIPIELLQGLPILFHYEIDFTLYQESDLNNIITRMKKGLKRL